MQLKYTPKEAAQLRQTTEKLMRLSAEELRAAHDSWLSTAQRIIDPTPDEARRLIIAHDALQAATHAKLDNIKSWQAIAWHEAYNDMFRRPS